MWHMMGNFGGPLFFGFGWIFMILFWAFIIVGIVALIKGISEKEEHPRVTKEKSPPAGGQTPLDILKERYAKGEINKEEFEEKKKDLS